MGESNNKASIAQCVKRSEHNANVPSNDLAVSLFMSCLCISYSLAIRNCSIVLPLSVSSLASHEHGTHVGTDTKPTCSHARRTSGLAVYPVKRLPAQCSFPTLLRHPVLNVDRCNVLFFYPMHPPCCSSPHCHQRTSLLHCWILNPFPTLPPLLPLPLLQPDSIGHKPVHLLHRRRRSPAFTTPPRPPPPPIFLFIFGH